MKVVFWGREFLRLKDIIGGAFAAHDFYIADPEADENSLSTAEMLVVRPMKVGDEFLSGAPSLRLVQQWGAGAEGIDLAACSRRGIYACNVPSLGTGNAEGVAEVAFLHMLLLAKRFFRAREKLLEGKVYTPPGIALWKKKACVLGLGNVGRSITSRMKAFGMTVAGVNRTPPKDGGAAWGVDTFFPLGEMAAAVRGARFVVCALALTGETEKIVDEALFSAMDRDAFFVNVARGPVVDRAALELALDEEWIAGAGLDVLWEEPHRVDDPLLTHPRVVVTPHIGGVNDASLEGVLQFILGNADRLAAGQSLSSCLNGEEMERKPT